MTNWIKLGKASKPHGIKGEVLLHLFNEEESSLEYIEVVRLTEVSEDPEDGKDYTLEKVRFGNKVIAKIEGIDNRNQIEDLLPFDIYVNEENLEPLEEGEFYLKDMIGIDVYDYESGELKGKIVSFYSNGVQDIFVIKGQSESWEVPHVESFFKLVDINKNRAEVLFPTYC